MPLRRQVGTLKQLCSHFIIENISQYPTQEFHSLPSNLLEDLINFPTDHVNKLERSEKFLFLFHTDLIRLIRGNIQHLKLNARLYNENNAGGNFNFCWKGDSLCKDLMNATLRVSNRLTHFLCGVKIACTDQDLLHFIHSIPNIVVLKLGDDWVNDDILEAIGDNCPKLESLNVLGKITDSGIRRLCQSKSCGSNVKYLKFKYADVNVEGCLTALHNLKQLRVFTQSFSYMLPAFEMLFRQLDGSQKLPTFQLCKLPPIGINCYPKGFLNFITKICPNLTILDLSISEDLAGHIDELKKCDRISKLSITNEFSLSDLAQVASKLTCLSLSDTNVDLELIGITCLNLTKLTLAISCQPLVNVKTNNNSFSKLQTLGIRSFIPTSQFSIPHLKFLLRNCLDLEKLKISHYNKITDDIMISILHEVNPLKNLTRFIICSCRNISKITVMTLLMLENKLEKIKVTSIDRLGIPYDDIVVIESYIKENNLLVQTDFSSEYILY